MWRAGGLSPLPIRIGGKATPEALFLESFKRAFPDAYSRENNTIIGVEHLAEARAKAAVSRAIETIKTDSLPHTAHLSLRDWAERLDIEIDPTWTEEDLRRELVDKYSAAPDPSFAAVKAKLQEILGDSYLGFFKGKCNDFALSWFAASGTSATPISPLATEGTMTGSGVYARLATGALQSSSMIAGFATANPAEKCALVNVATIPAPTIYDKYFVTDTTPASVKTTAITLHSDSVALLVFLMIDSANTEVSVKYNGFDLQLLAEVIVPGDTDLRAATYLYQDIDTPMGGANLVVQATELTPTGELRVMAVQLSEISLYEVTTASATNGETVITAPVRRQTYWPLNEAPDQNATINGWLSSRAQYFLVTEPGVTSGYTTQDAVKRAIDSKVARYLNRVLPACETWDYTVEDQHVGDIVWEGFVVGESLLGYVAMGSIYDTL